MKGSDFDVGLREDRAIVPDRPLTGAAKIGDLSLKLADAALIARERGDEVQALFFAVKAAETLQLAKLLGWKLPSPPQGSGQNHADAHSKSPSRAAMPKEGC